MVQQTKGKGGRAQRVGTPSPMDFKDFHRALDVLTGRYGFYNWAGLGQEFCDVRWSLTQECWVSRGYIPLHGERWARRNLLRRMQAKYHTHPVVEELLPISRPWDWHLLLLEFPAYSVDMKRIAYFRSERDMRMDRRTVTSVAKYVQRHWGGLIPDHVIRDIAAKYTAAGFRVVTDIKEMVELVRVGPVSCQRWGRGDCKPSTVGDPWNTHPYQAYDPAKGWALVVQEVNGEVKSRCLVYSGPADDGDKGYVRIYGNEPETAAWLESEGYEQWDGWPEGAEIRAGEPWPYVDGDTNCVDWDGESSYVELSVDGDELSDTTGEGPCSQRCDCCGDRIRSRDDSWSTYNDDVVCEYCLDNEYCYARDRHGDYHYFPEDDCVNVHGDWYYIHHAPECGVVQDHEGEWQLYEDCVYCVDVDDYVLAEEATYYEPDGEYYLDPPEDEPEEDEDDEPDKADEQG